MMSRVIQVSILGKISGNVNADEVIGNRITMKKMYTSNGEVLPYVSARAVRFAIRKALNEWPGLKIDPFEANPNAKEQLRLMDSGNPNEFVDNDLFGYMVTTGKGKETYKRYSPIAVSYFKALRDTPIKSEFAARFPRENEDENEPDSDKKKRSDPVPFEVEVAEFIGRLNVLIYDYVGDYTKSTTYDPKKVKEPKELYEERCKRLSAFLQILLTPSYVLPRRSSSLNIPEYLGALVCLSEVGPLPIYQYMDYSTTGNGAISINTNHLRNLGTRTDISKRIEEERISFFLIDFNNSLLGSERKTLSKIGINKKDLPELISDACDFLFGTSGNYEKA
jgi:CRISPR-associated protein Cst2